MQHINESQILVKKLLQLKICDKIDIDNVSYIFKAIKYTRPIPIGYYQTKLTEVNNLNILCNLCKKKANYNDNINNYCWFHSQIINNS
jgi:hypothetical protein